MYNRYFYFLMLFLLLKLVAIVILIFQGGIGLGPDEAQYWTWSQQLDWGYYSKPPGIAWEIGVGTSFFGNTEFGVRSIPLLIGTAIPIALFFLLKRCGLSLSVCFWGALAFALSPIGILASFLAITDSGMILFWILSCSVIVKNFDYNKPPNYFLLGIMILCGALFKWPIYFLWPVLLSSWIFFPWLISRHFLTGFSVSLLALLPTLYWNAAHEWATFRHVFATMIGGHGQVGMSVQKGALFWGRSLEFLGSQVALLSPILFVLMILAFYSLIKQRKSVPNSIFFCGMLSLGIFVIFLLISLVMKIQGNWGIFIYPTALVAIAWYCCNELKRMRLLKGAIVLSVLLCGVIFSIPTIQSRNIFNDFPIPYRFNTFHHNIGWEKLKNTLDDLGYEPSKDFLFSDKYQTVSVLSFYASEQKRAYFLNLQGTRKNQFSFWPGMEKMASTERGFFVAVEKMSQLEQRLSASILSYQEQLQLYFKKVTFLGVKPLFISYQKSTKAALIFECVHYNGSQPTNSDLY
jgi:4-amino-4-deoxy-L-arabinose transferase-like glycosyltransferase